MRLKHRLKKSSSVLGGTLLLFFLFSAFQIQANRIYVVSHGTGCGSSWQYATNLQNALKNAVYGTEIWVSKGTYFPTLSNDRKASFHIPDGVKLFGGFHGHENRLTDRSDPFKVKTILSGEIGSALPNDNSYNVITTREAGSATEIDGFHIKGGYADKWKDPQGSRYRSGGGWYHRAGKSDSSPWVRNCVFEKNVAVDGGAVYNNSAKSNTTLLLSNCRFKENTAFLDGGGIYNDCRLNGKVNLVIRECIFDSNEGNNGACIFNYSFNGHGVGKILDCRFNGNLAVSRGSIVYDGSTKSEAFIINNCQFAGNKSFEGGNFYKIAGKVKERPVGQRIKQI